MQFIPFVPNLFTAVQQRLELLEVVEQAQSALPALAVQPLSATANALALNLNPGNGPADTGVNDGDGHIRKSLRVSSGAV